MKNNFYFWRHTNSNIPKFQHYLDKIQQLCSGQTSGLDIEKLRGTEFIFSLRLDHAARLIFTYYKDQVCLLELLDNHQYERCRFIENPQLVKYVLNAFSRSKHICEVDAPKDKPMGRAIPLELHHNQFIQFSEQQEKIFEASLPLVVAGPAGSGKTWMAISMLSNAIDETLPQKMIYVTKSPALALQLKNHWQDTMPEVAKHVEIEFVTYAQLLPAGVKLIEDEESHFKSWLKEIGRPLPYPIEFVWQEFRIISGVDSFEQYTALGRKQCLFHEFSEKHECYDFYQAYHKYLKSSGLCSPSLFKLLPNPIYDLMVIDEAQDLSHCQLANLNGLAKNAKIVYFLGDHQLLFDFKSKLNFIKQMYHDVGIHVSPLVLTQSYRCPPQVVELANCLIRTKYLVTGGLADALENPIISIADGFQDKVGQVRWIDPKNELLTTEILPHAQNHYFAVIVMDSQLIPQAVDFFQCEPARVFTPESIKGLEFKVVVLWRPLIGLEAKEVNKLLQSVSTDDEKESACAAVHRPKAGHGHEVYLHFFNRLITAVTRCQQTLIWVESEQHRPILHLIEHLKPGFVKSIAKVEMIEASKQEDWQQLVIDYFYQDNIQGAQDIFSRHLQADYSNFEHFCQMHGLVRAQALPIMPAVKEVPVAAVASCSAIEDYSFAHAFFDSQQKKESWSYKSEIQEIIDAKQLPERLGQFLMQFKSGVALDNFLFKEKCIKVAESKRKTNHFCFIDFLKDTPSIWLFVSELASHTQLLAKISIKKLKKHLGEQHKVISLLNNLEPVQELLYQQLDLKHISEKEVLNPAIDFPVIHFLLKFKRLDLLGALITAGAPLEALDQHGQSLLHAAALSRDYQGISTLYKLGFDMNTSNKKGHAIAFLATTLGDRSLFETLNACGIDWHQKQSNSLTPFQQALRWGELEMVDLILTHQPKPLDYINSLKPFHTALGLENPIAMCKKLLSKKLDPLQEYNNEESFFDFLMRLEHFNEHRMSILTDLNDAGLSLDTWSDKKSFNLAHLAARHDRVDVIDWLITHEKFLPLLSATKASSPPIEQAIKSQSIKVLQKLISLGDVGGLKPELFEKFGMLAMFTKNPQMIVALHQGKVSFDFLIQNESLIHFAVRINSPPLIDALRYIGVDINQPNEAGQTPFLYAAIERKIESLDKLRKFDELEIDAQDIHGNGIVHILAITNQCSVLEDLLSEKRFYKLALKTNLTGFSPFSLGVLHNHLEVVQIFLNFDVQQPRSENKNLDVVCLALQNDNADMLNLLANSKFDIYQSIGGVSPISISITDNRPACCQYLLKDSIQGTAPLGQYFSPLFMITSLGKIEFLALLKEISYNFYQTNELGENILHVLMQSDWNPQNIKSFVFKLNQLGINIYHLLFQLDVHENDPMFYLLDKKQLDLILYFEVGYKVLWPISNDEVDRVRKILPEDLTEEDVRVVSTYGFCNTSEGLAARYFRHVARTGQIDIIQWLVDCYKKSENHTQPVQNLSMFVRKHGDLEMVLWECIFIAIEHGQLATLQKLSSLGVPLDRLDLTYSYTSLEYAIRYKQLDIFKFIASQSKLLLTKETYTVVHSAAMYDACDILRLIYGKVALRPFFTQVHPIDGREPFEEALPVMVAAGSGSLNALKTLKNDCGADICASVSKDYDAMWFSIDKNYFNQEILEYLVTEGCDVNKEYDAGKMTLLMKTATTGQYEALPILKDLGAKFDWMCLETKRNILLYCVANNQVEYLKKLMDYPIDLTHVDCNGFNALHVAIVHSNFEIFQWMLSQPKFQILIHMTDIHGRTPMHFAKFEHELEMFALLEEVSSKTQLGFFEARHETSEQTDSSNANQP